MAERLSDYNLVCEYKYLRPDGSHCFSKHRFEQLNPISGERKKTFRYWDPVERRRHKPAGADALLYRLPEVLAAVAAGQPVHWAEGEKDADALARAGVVATSHHQGAGHVTPEQAAWLVGARQVVLWVDLDRERWEVGAFDAALRHDLLLEVGVRPNAIRFRKARVGKDAADHLAAGYSVGQARRVDPLKLAAVAAQYTPAAAHALGYRRYRRW